MSPVPFESKRAFQLVSDHDDELGLPVADQSVYAPFASWLDEQLDELVAKWLHWAAPRASQRERTIRRMNRS